MNGEKPAPNQLQIVDRNGQVQTGTVEEFLSDPGKGVETLRDAIAVAFYDFTKRAEAKKK
jgi:hypothetical protein